MSPSVSPFFSLCLSLWLAVCCILFPYTLSFLQLYRYLLPVAPLLFCVLFLLSDSSVFSSACSLSVSLVLVFAVLLLSPWSCSHLICLPPVSSPAGLAAPFPMDRPLHLFPEGPPSLIPMSLVHKSRMVSKDVLFWALSYIVNLPREHFSFSSWFMTKWCN